MRKPHEVNSELPLHALLFQANQRVTAELRSLTGVEGVPVEFWRVLEVMADERGRSMSALAKAAGMQMPATSKLVDRMVDAALLQRSMDLHDQRRVVLHISDFGLQKVDALRSDMAEHSRRARQGLSAPRERQLRELLQDFIKIHQPTTE